MIQLFVNYFSQFPDLAIFIGLIIFIIPIGLLIGQRKIGILSLASYISFAVVSSIPDPKILSSLSPFPFFNGEIIVFLGLLLLISLFFFFSALFAPGKKYFLKSLSISILFIFLFSSFYFELYSHAQTLPSPLIQTLFTQPYAEAILRLVPALIIPFLAI